MKKRSKLYGLRYLERKNTRSDVLAGQGIPDTNKTQASGGGVVDQYSDQYLEWVALKYDD